MKKNPNIKIVRSTPKEVFEQLIEQKITRKQLAAKFGVSISFMDKVLSELGLKTKGYYHNPYVNGTVFDVIDTEEKAYWLGFLFADGYVGYSKGKYKRVVLKLGEIDRDHVIKFKHFLGDTRDDDKHVIREKSKSRDKTRDLFSYSYYVYNDSLFDTLVKIGCTTRKSLTLKFPDKNIFAKEELVYDFIRGYLDGDGCLTMSSSNKNRIRISIVGTEDFLLGIQRFFPQFRTVYRFKSSEVFWIACESNKADQVAYKLYENATIYLNRKYLRYTTLCKLHNSEKSDKIGESCDANAEVTPEIAKGSESTVENSE
jgi:intein/homing endonuclease